MLFYNLIVASRGSLFCCSRVHWQEVMRKMRNETLSEEVGSVLFCFDLGAVCLIFVSYIEQDEHGYL